VKSLKVKELQNSIGCILVYISGL